MNKKGHKTRQKQDKTKEGIQGKTGQNKTELKTKKNRLETIQDREGTKKKSIDLIIQKVVNNDSK